MLVKVLQSNERILLRGAALILLTGLAAGCSSQSIRLNGIDDVFTGATANQRAIINGDQQPYPGDSASSAPAVATQPVTSGSLAPVTSRPLAAPAAAPRHTAPVVAEATQTGTLQAPRPEKAKAPAPKASSLDKTVTGTVEASRDRKAAVVAAAEAPEEVSGWSRAGGTQVTAKQGETVYNLSRRFGVPAKVLMKMNGISADGSLTAGQKVVIPTYVYSSKAPVSAPDSDPKVAEAKSSTGVKSDLPGGNVPLPEKSPQDKVAVLPQAQKLKDANKLKLPDAAAGDTKKPAAKAGIYTVAEGDSLARIAKRHGVSTAALKAANGLEDGKLRIGQSLKIPAAGEPVLAAAEKPEGAAKQVKLAKADAKKVVDPVATGSTGPTKSQTLAGEEEQIANSYTPPKASKVIEQAEASPDSAPDATGIGKMRWPVRGRVITPYGKASGKSSDGIDIAVPEGTPVKAAENGVVIYAGDGLKDFGNTVLVRHEDGLVTVYGNASALKVQRGQKVKRGEEIAVSGMSGNADSPKLHFEVRKNSAPVDPSTFLE